MTVPLTRLIVIFSLIFSGCASVQTPGGGPRDVTPPKIVSEVPQNLTRNFSAREIELEFDEFIKPLTVTNEISISPALSQPLSFRVKKDLLQITLPDSLAENTTYTINFGNALADYNAGNVLKNYTYVFSTGNIIDSLSISGQVVQTLTKTPEKDVTVLLIPTNQDSLFGRRPASIFTSTDSAGNFILQNLRSDTYRLYALKEQGPDRIYNSTTEEIAFLPDSISLTENRSGIVLELFKEIPVRFITEDWRLEPDGRIFLRFNRPIKAPSLKILNPRELDSRKTVEFSSRGDTALLWLPEITFDSLSVAVQEEHTALDTIIFRRSRRDTYNRSLTITDNINTGISNINKLALTFTAPVDTYDPQKVRVLDDTTTVRGVQILKDTSSSRRYIIDFPWQTGHIYTIRADENAFTGPFGGNKFYTGKFRKSDENIYGNLILNIGPPQPGNYIVELIRDETNTTRNNRITGKTTIEYRNIPIGRYTIRIIYDTNGNGVWDTGNVVQARLPEKVWNLPKAIILRANWELTETISIPAAP